MLTYADHFTGNDILFVRSSTKLIQRRDEISFKLVNCRFYGSQEFFKPTNRQGNNGINTQEIILKKT